MWKGGRGATGTSATAAGTSGSCSGGSASGSGAAVGSPVRRHPAYEQVEGPPLLESIE